MERINRLLKHPIYKKYVEDLQDYECNRQFCRHNMEHFLTVARIAYIISLEDKLNINIEEIYAAALTHDIGRLQQYIDNSPHEIVSADIAPYILKDVGFLEQEITRIREAILNHRNKDISMEGNLSCIIYRADKMSRDCLSCPAFSECHRKGKGELNDYWR